MNRRATYQPRHAAHRRDIRDHIAAALGFITGTIATGALCIATAVIL